MIKNKQSSAIDLNKIFDIAENSGIEITNENQDKIICFYMAVKAEFFLNIKQSCFSDFMEFTNGLKEIDYNLRKNIQ